MSVWIEYQWREALSSVESDDIAPEWSALHRVPEDAGSVRFLGLLPGEAYDVRVRYVDDDCCDDPEVGPWTTRLDVVAGYPVRDPPAPVEVRQTSSGCLSWRQPSSPVDVIGYRIRHAPGIHSTWDTMEDAHEGFVAASPWPLCELPGGLRTVAIAAVDKWHNESTTPTFVTLHVRPLDDVAAVTIRTEALAGQTSAQRSGTADQAPFWRTDLEPMWSNDAESAMWVDDDAPMWGALRGDARTSMWSDDETVAMWDLPYAWVEHVATLTVATHETGVSARVSIGAVIDSPNAPWAIQYRRPGGATPMWSESGKSAMWDADSTTAMWADVNEPWRAWPGRVDGIADPGPWRARVLVPGGPGQGEFTSGSWTVSAPMREETTLGAKIPADGGRVTPTTPFVVVSDVRVQQVDSGGVGVALRSILTDRNRTNGPNIEAQDDAGVSQLAYADVTIRGA